MLQATRMWEKSFIFVIFLIIKACGQSYFEIMVYHIYRKYLLPSSRQSIIHILDIGAHDTEWARNIQQILYDYQIEFFQIEGNNQHASRLEEFGHLYCLALVGDIDGETVIFHKSNYPEYTTGNSIFKELSTIYEHDTMETRQMYRLDTILNEASYDEIFEIVKYDVQGSEKKALLGSENTLKRMDSGMIVIESALLPVNGGNAASLLDIQLILESFGFTLVDVMGEHYLKTSTGCQLVQIDAIYVKKNRAVLNDETERFSWPPVPG